MGRTRLVRGQDGQSWDGQGLSAVKTDNHGTDKGCPRPRLDGQGLSVVKTGRTRVVRGQDGTDKGCPRSTRDGQGLSVSGRTRVVRGQDGTDKGCPRSIWDDKGYPVRPFLTADNPCPSRLDHGQLLSVQS
uniref:Uncharacterized protein n=1 Tax=Acrobeloides nanus TaxID=290746 RepID=A0A914C7A4_9BILA